MNEEINPENVRIHSRADELIACLEGEIAKRDEVIVGLTNSRDFWREKAIAADDKLAAIKAQEPAAWTDGSGAMYSASLMASLNIPTGGLTPLYAAPVSEANAQGVVLPERKQYHDYLSLYDKGEAIGHNNALSEVARLNAAPAAPAADAGLVEALETIINPIEAMRRELQVGEQLNGMVAMQLASDPEYLRGVAKAAIAAHCAKGVV